MSISRIELSPITGNLSCPFLVSNSRQLQVTFHVHFSYTTLLFLLNILAILLFYVFLNYLIPPDLQPSYTIIIQILISENSMYLILLKTPRLNHAQGYIRCGYMRPGIW